MKQTTKKKIAMLLVVCMLFTLLPTMALAESSTTATSETAPAFQDVSANAYYYNAVQWAAQNNITGGVSKTQFAPDLSCTRAQIVTFLWRAAGRPEPTTTTNPFVDVSEDDYYYKAVLWAVEKGITAGTSATTFSPDATCTRAQAVTFIYRSEKANGGGFTGAWMFRLPFTDVPECYYEAVAWCYMQKITGGTDDTTFSPDAACTRGQIVAMLYRYWQATQTEEQNNDIAYSGGGGSYVPSTSTPSIATYTITTTASAYGTISPANPTVNSGDSQTFTITPNAHYHIEKVVVDGEDKGATDTYTFTDITEEHTIDVTFAIDTFQIITKTTTGGSIIGNTTVNYNDNTTFTITADSGYSVKDVKVDGTSVGPVTSYTFDGVKENHAIEVIFVLTTIVTDATSFRNAVKQDGIIVLANDITLDDNGKVEISKNVTIRGNGHGIELSSFSGYGWSRPISVSLLKGASVISENCDFTGSGLLQINIGAELEVYGGNFDVISNLGTMRMFSGTVNNNLEIYAGSGFTLLYDVCVGKNFDCTWGTASDNCWILGKNFYDICSIRGGTFYFDPTEYLDTDKYKATQTKDTDGVDIWVVTEK